MSVEVSSFPGMATASSKPSRPSFRCSECGASVVRWHGRCPGCQSWGTLTEAATVRGVLRKVTPGVVATPARPISTVSAAAVRMRPSGIGEFDRVLGGGLVPGSVTLLAGEPGVGKSTLLLTAAHAWTNSGAGRALLVTGEESAEQV